MACKSIVFILSLFALLSLQAVNGFTLELIHPNSPANPLRNTFKTQFNWTRAAYNHTRSRAAAIQSRLGGASKFRTNFNDADLGYVMKYSIGTPPFDTYGVADTCSHITWLQCEPCSSCFEQTFPKFDPGNSESYRTAACASNECTIVPDAGCSDNDVCQYEVSYNDKTQTSGDVSIDTITLGYASFQNVVFGCGHVNEGEYNTGSSGMVGLGNSEVSIVKQLDEEIGGKFAYCMSSNPTSQSHISFGQDALVQGPDAVPINLFLNPDDVYYWLSLKEIIVDGTNFPVNPPATETAGNIIIDSGATLTMLPSDLVNNVVSKLMTLIPATPVNDPNGEYKLCYSSNEEFTVPEITFNFVGGSVVLPAEGLTFVHIEDIDLSCLSIIPEMEGGVSMFGYLSQADFLIGYDLVAKTVTFMPADCSTY